MKNLFIAAIVLALCAIVGCKKENETTPADDASADTLALLSKAVGELRFPHAIGSGDGTVDTVAIIAADSTMHLRLTLDDDYIDSAAIAQSRPYQQFVLQLVESDDTLARLLGLARRVPVELAVDVAGRTSAVTASFAIPAAEFRAMRLDTLGLREKDEVKVRNRVVYDNRSCPYQLEEGVVMIGMNVQDRYVTFRTEIDVEKLDFKLMKQNRDSVSIGVVDWLRSQLDDSLQRRSLLDIADARFGYRNRYIASDRQDSFDISFTPTDLQRMIEVADSVRAAAAANVGKRKR